MSDKFNRAEMLGGLPMVLVRQVKQKEDFVNIPTVQRYDSNNVLSPRSYGSRSLESSFGAAHRPRHQHRDNHHRQQPLPIQISSSGKLTLLVPQPDSEKGTTRTQVAAVSSSLLIQQEQQQMLNFQRRLPNTEKGAVILPPVHRASGDLSVSLTSGEADDDSPKQKKKYSSRPRKSSLWNVGTEDSLDGVEQKRKEEAAEQLRLQLEEEAALKAAEVEQQAKTEDQKGYELMLLLETANTMFGKHITLDELPDSESRGRTSREAAIILPAIQKLAPKFRNREIRKSRQMYGPLLDPSEHPIMTSEIRMSLSELAASKAREKLKNLARFVNGHTNRKIQSCWTMIERRFKASSHHKVIMKADNKHGLMHPIKIQAIYASALASTLCSSRVKVGYRELTVILDHFGATDEQVLLARQIAALNAVINVCAEAKSEMTEVYTNQMHELLKQETFLVSIDELIEFVFSPDEIERKQEMDTIKANSKLEAQTFIDEKRKRDEKKAKLAAARQKLAEEFDKLLRAPQLLKGVFNRRLVDTFLFVLSYCDRHVADYEDEQTSKVPADILSFLGIDAFPAHIQEKVKTRMDRNRGKKKNRKPALNVAQKIGGFDHLNNISSGEISRSSSQEDDSFSLSCDSQDQLETSGTVITTKTNDGQQSVDTALFELNQFKMAFEPEGEEDQTPDNPRRIKLAGPPHPAKQLLRALVGIGKTFPGLSYREAVEILQFVAATKIASYFRAFCRRWRFFKARLMWKIKYHALLDWTFRDWKQKIQHFVQLRSHCLRKLRAWRWYTKYTIYRREVFRLCFWPLRTWRKYAEREAIAKEKSKFLVGRVLPTVTLMHIFRAWKKYSANEWRLFRLEEQFRREIIARRSQDMLLFLRSWAHKRRHIRRAWYRKGQTMRRKNITRVRRMFFVIWKVFAQLRKFTRSRARTEYLAFKALLLYNRKPLEKSSFTDRRLKASTKRITMEEAYRKNKIELDRKSMVVGQHARRTTVTNTRSSSEQEKALAKLKEELLLKQKNNASMWKKDRNWSRWFDVDSDGEDGDHIPAVLIDCYQRAQITPFLPPPSSAASTTNSLSSITSKTAFKGSEENPVKQVAKATTEASSRSGSKSTNKLRRKSNDKNTKKMQAIISEDGRNNLNIISAEEAETVDAEESDIGTAPPTLVHDTIEFHRRYSDNIMIMSRAESTLRGYNHRDLWNLLDGSMRFHRFAKLAFRNLQLFARQHKKVKVFLQQKRATRLQLVWAAWRKYSTDTANFGSDDGGDSPTGKGSRRAEQLVYRTRSQHSSKIMRTRKWTNEVISNLNRDPEEKDSDEEEERRAVKKMKNLNFIEDDNELKRQEQQATMLRIKSKRSMLYKNNYQPPNLLDFDRKDRDYELQLATDMLRFGKETHQSVAALALQAESRTKQWKELELEQEGLTDDILASETTVTDLAVKKEEEYASRFKIHAANMLVSALAKVRAEVLDTMLKAESKIYFRGLRLPFLIARSKHMLNRKKLKNWIRICCRLRSLYAKAGYYRRMRTMWVTYNRWLKFLEAAKTNPTASFTRMLKRRLLLHPDFDRELRTRGFINHHYTTDDRFHSSLSDFKVLFTRWKMYTQENVLFRLMSDRVVKLRRLKTLSKCFFALKHDIDIPYHYHQFQKQQQMEKNDEDGSCFPMIQLQADLDQLTKRFIPLRKHILPSTIKLKNLKVIQQLKVASKEQLTFKKFMTGFTLEIAKRLSTEQRLLFDAFEERGTQVYTHVLAPLRSDFANDIEGNNENLIPGIMSKLTEAKAFHDPKDMEAIPAGYKLTKVKLAMVILLGANNSITVSNILGWQLQWTAEGTAREIESRPRGSWHSAGISIVELLVPKDDFLVGVEYLYDGPIMCAMRLKCFHAGWGKWAGGRPSLSTLSVSLPVEIAPQLPFERERVLPSDEIKNPALPYAHIIGFSGLLYTNKATALGLVVRKIQHQSLFSYTWVQDALHQRRLQETENGEIGLEASVALQPSLPSQVVVNGNEQEQQYINNEELTNSFNGEEDNGSLDIDHNNEDEDDENDEGGDTFDDRGAVHFSQPLTSRSNNNHKNSAPNSARSHHSAASSSSRRGKGSSRRLEFLRKQKFRQLQKFDDNGVAKDEPLTQAETQFFDTLRMRMTELAGAKTRVIAFARRLWTSKDLSRDPQLSKLLTLPIVAALCRWFYTAISKRLLPVYPTEAEGNQLLKSARKLHIRSLNLAKRSATSLAMANSMEVAVMPWTGKHLLAPQERLARKEHNQRIVVLRENSAIMAKEAEESEALSIEQYKRGFSLLPRLSLSKSYYDHFHNKVLAARHKENLLERMSLEEVKKGLFGSNMKETLLNQDQMQAIHASLKDRKIELKDTTSFQRLVDDILVDEQRRLHTSIMKKATEHAAKINQQFKEQSMAARALKQADEEQPKKLFPLSLTVKTTFKAGSAGSSKAMTPIRSKPDSSSNSTSAHGEKLGQGKRSLSQSMSGPIVTVKAPAILKQSSYDDSEAGNSRPDHHEQRLRNLSVLSSPTLSVDDKEKKKGQGHSTGRKKITGSTKK